MQDELETIIKEEILQWFKQNKYRRQGRSVFKQLENHGICFNVDSSKYNTSDHKRVWFNSGIFIQSVHDILWGVEERPKFPKEYHCLERKRIGDIRGDWKKYERSYIFEEGKDISQMKVDMLEDFEYFKTYLLGVEKLNFVERYNKLDLDMYHPDYDGVAVYLYLNGYEEASKDKLIKKYHNTKAEFHLNILKRLGISY
ncbi:DUF4304 domain-containing protein [Paenibacillus methanolicus]|uniref:Uncharacterized protein DUF4304 n=1 Tax=Paenibacillus methanolicus TaxID=582686 RepID=A0A5S5CLN7_9BACL|nr:DUF4304 domain-containing protein [Paenibacillus methanolicus]TYP79431.1 uncharacterized protein DUF4304 [Paenibacillus methanolicus]